jgi:AraC family transcriptional regulator
VAELCRRLESDPPTDGSFAKWELGLVFANLLRLGHAHRRRQKPPVLRSRRFDRVLTEINAELEGGVLVDHLAEIDGGIGKIHGQIRERECGDRPAGSAASKK